MINESSLAKTNLAYFMREIIDRQFKTKYEAFLQKIEKNLIRDPNLPIDKFNIHNPVNNALLIEGEKLYEDYNKRRKTISRMTNTKYIEDYPPWGRSKQKV